MSEMIRVTIDMTKPNQLYFQYFKDSWELLDFTIVLVSIVDSTIGVVNSLSTSSGTDGLLGGVLQSTKQFKVIRLLLSLIHI